MNNEQNQNNQQNQNHQKTKKTLKVISIVLLGCGIILAAIGFISFFSAFNNGGFPKYFWCTFVGLPMLGIGGSIASVANRREIATYMKNEDVPVVNEASKELSPAIKNVASAIKEGLSGTNTDGIRCSCGELNEKGDKYCSACGKTLLSVCPYCGKEIDADDKYCGQCGNSL